MRPVADVLKRAALALSALSFKRVYGIGGAVLLVVLVSDGTELIDSSSWQGAIVAWLLKDRIETILLVSLVLPLIATALSEIAFFLVLWLGKSEVTPFDFIPIQVEEVIEESRSKRNVGNGGVRDEAETKRTTSRLLIPTPSPAGGLKQVIRCFASQAFRSHFGGYEAYSGLVGKDDSRELADSYRVVVLAKDADATDFEWNELRAFQMKRVTDGCWILVRDPVPRDVARESIERREQLS